MLMRERDPFTVARTALAGYAAAGRFGWGRPLVATSLAAELGLSPTPVREALAHLAGEGVIEHRPGRGYFALSPTASDIAGLYDLHRQFLRWSFASTVAAEDRPEAVDGDAVARIEGVFDHLAGLGRNRVVFDSFRRVVSQLRPIRRIELLIQDTDLEGVLEIERLLAEGLADHLTDAIDKYHEGRVVLSADIEKVMRQSV